MSREAGEPWKDKLLVLPAFLYEGAAGRSDRRRSVADGFALTGFFLLRAPRARTARA